MTDDLAAQRRSHLPTVEIVTLPEAGHDRRSRDPDAYLAVAVIPFLAVVDVGGAHRHTFGQRLPTDIRLFIDTCIS
nr:hypothetical protein [Micromonospora sp. DSM 115978]